MYKNLSREKNFQVKWYQSVAFKFILGLALVITLFFFVVGYWITSSQTKMFLEQAAVEASMNTNFIKTRLEKEMLKGMALENIRPLINALSLNSKIDKIMLMNLQGEVRYSNDESLIGYNFNLNEHEGCLVCHRDIHGAPNNLTVLTTDHRGKKVLRSSLPFENKETCHTCHSPKDRNRAMLIVDMSFFELEQTLMLVKKTFVLGLKIISVILFLVIFVFLKMFLSNPLNRILKGIREIGKGNLEYSISEEGRDELSVVSRTFNAMTTDLKNSFMEIKQKNMELNALYSTVDQLSKTMDINELQRIIIDIFQKIFNINSVYIVMRTFKKDDIEIFGKEAAQDEVKFAGNISEAEKFLSNVQEKILADGFTRLHQQELDSDILSEDKTRFLVPLYFKKEIPFGFVYMEKIKGSSFENEDEQKTIMAIVNHISVATTNARLYSQSITDDLSRLYTKKFFLLRAFEEIQRHFRYGDRFSLMMIDIDKFKEINDTYGHLAGDLAIKTFSNLLKTKTRAVDICARYGGDEFIVLLPNSNIEQAIIVAEKVRKEMEKEEISLPDSQDKIKFTLSIGIATCPDNAKELEDLISKADTALYHSKQSGRNKVSIYSA